MKEKATKPEEHQSGRKKLSKREVEVMNSIARGLQPRHIASELAINPKTVNTYRARILRKLDLKSTGDIVKYSVLTEANSQNQNETISLGLLANEDQQNNFNDSMQ